MESLFGWSDNMVLLMTLPLVFGDVMAIFFYDHDQTINLEDNRQINAY